MSTEPPHLLILTALAFEARPIARALNLRWTSRTNAISAQGDVRLQVVGPRAARLPTSTSGCTGVIMAGLAGGLVPKLRRGDVIVDEQGVAIALGSLRRGGIATLATLAATPADKASLHERSGALVVDMENAIVRDWARDHTLPFVGIRGVSDTSSETLDPATLRIVDTAGSLSPTRLAGEIARRPAFVRSLWRLRSTKQVVDGLAVAVKEVVDAMRTR